MSTLFNPDDCAALSARLNQLRADTPRQWGKMNAAQMVTHCGRPLEIAVGDRPSKQSFLGRIITPFIRKSILGEKPFIRNSPTDPKFVVSDERELSVERQRLLDLIDRFVDRGAAAANHPHSFFGKLNGDEWGILMYKHIDHHLRQFGL